MYYYLFYLFIMEIVHNSTTYQINVEINVEDKYLESIDS